MANRLGQRSLLRLPVSQPTISPNLVVVHRVLAIDPTIEFTLVVDCEMNGFT